MGNSASADNFGQNDAPVVVYSKTTCPWCVKAKNLLEDQKIDYVAFELNKMANGGQISNSLRNTTKLTYVPQIFVCGNLIGGFMELQQLQSEGKLREMTEKCSRTNVSR